MFFFIFSFILIMTPHIPHDAHKPCVTAASLCLQGGNGPVVLILIMTPHTTSPASLLRASARRVAMGLLFIFSFILIMTPHTTRRAQALHHRCEPLLAGWQWACFWTTTTMANASTTHPHSPRAVTPYAAAVSLCSQGGNGPHFWTTTTVVSKLR